MLYKYGKRTRYFFGHFNVFFFIISFLFSGDVHTSLAIYDLISTRASDVIVKTESERKSSNFRF